MMRKHKANGLARGPADLYPVDWRDARRLLDPKGRVESLLRPTTLAVHAWRSKLISNGVVAYPPAESWLGRKCTEHAIGEENRPRADENNGSRSPIPPLQSSSSPP
jgi:hypothetical protein